MELATYSPKPVGACALSTLMLPEVTNVMVAGVPEASPSERLFDTTGITSVCDVVPSDRVVVEVSTKTVN